MIFNIDSSKLKCVSTCLCTGRFKGPVPGPEGGHHPALRPPRELPGGGRPDPDPAEPPDTARTLQLHPQEDGAHQSTDRYPG